MDAVFYISAAVAIVSTILAITRLNIVHALLYMVLSLFAVAIIFFILGAPFVAALEVVVYAGAIMVLIIFVIMMVNQGPQTVEQERQWLRSGIGAWVGPVILAAILVAELLFILTGSGNRLSGVGVVEPAQVAIALYGPYVLGVEMASMLLLAGLVGAYLLGQRRRADEGKEIPREGAREGEL